MSQPVNSPIDPRVLGNASASDPRPIAPEAPLASDCCDSGCPMCVYDIHADEMQHYREQLALWLQRHPQAQG